MQVIEKRAALPETLPSIARTVVQVLGFDEALRVISKLGGATWRFGATASSANSNESRQIIALIGYRAYTALQKHFAGETLYIPKCHRALLDARNAKIRAEMAGLAIKAPNLRRLTRLFNLSDRRIRQLLAERPQAPQSPQLSLLGEY